MKKKVRENKLNVQKVHLNFELIDIEILLFNYE